MGDITLSAGVRQNLLSLQNTADLMSTTQNRLATGKKVNSALDNPTNFFTSQSLQARSSDLGSLMDSMANGIKTLEAADNGLTAITKNLESMQSTLRQARQDKSFSTQSYDVTDATEITLKGGAGVDTSALKLQPPSPGTKAKVVSAAAYAGPNITGTQNGGARTDITYNATMLGKTDITVDDIAIDLSAGSITDADSVAAAMQTQLDAAADGTYTVTNNAGTISIETTATGPTATSPSVSLGSSKETFGKAVFTYDADRMGSSITVDGTSVAVGGDATSFAANLQSSLDAASAGAYEVSVDTDTDEITVASTVAGPGTTPSITGGSLSATAAETTFTFDSTEGQALTIGGTSLVFGAGETDANIISAFQADTGFDAAYDIASDGNGNFTVTAKTPGSGATAPSVSNSAATTFSLDYTNAQDLTIGGFATTGTAIGAGDADSDVITAMNAVTGFSAAYDITSDGSGNFTIISKTAGAGTGPAVSSTDGGQVTSVQAYSPTSTSVSNVSAVAGEDAVPVTTTAGTDGTSQTSAAAPVDDLKVTYGNKSVSLQVGFGTSDQIAASINQQLSDAGIAAKASFDVDGKLQLEADSAEGKTLAISGADSNAIFGGDSVSVGEAPVLATNATKAVDRFVEILNRDYSTQLRASNDNGKLRIENLSTQDLSVSVDKDGAAGADAATTSTVKGNSVRKDLANQYNSLRDQLDKLSDDASFNGINLLRGDKLTISFNETGTSSLDIQSKAGKSVNSGNLGLDTEIGASALDNDDDIDAMLATVKEAMNTIRSQASAFGSNLSQVQNRQEFTKSMMNTLQTGADNLVLADTNEEAANMLALQTRQQLSSTALSMASQADQAALRLF